MNVPALRFKQSNGQDFPEWELWELGHLADKVNIKNREMFVKHVLTNSATQGIVSQSEYFDRDIVNKNNLDGYYIVELNDFVYNPRISSTAPVGPIKRNKLAIGVMSPLYTVFRFKKGYLNYLEQYFETRFWHEYLRSVANSGVRHDRMNITNKDFFSLPILLPTEPEQIKIANFLTTIDEKITHLTQKCELIGQYKKGVMQQIFSQEIRFKDDDGQDFPEWELVQLRDLLYESKSRNTELTYSKNEVLSVSGEYGVVNQIKHLGRSYAGSSVHNYHILDVGDVVYTKSPLKNNPYGIIKVNLKDTGIVSTLYATYKCKANVMGELIDYYFQSDVNLNNYLRPLVRKGAKNDMKVNNAHVLTGFIPFPNSIHEQGKIVQFLTSLDEKLRATKDQLIAAKQYKQGLLQKMFV